QWHYLDSDIAAFLPISLPLSHLVHTILQKTEIQTHNRRLFHCRSTKRLEIVQNQRYKIEEIHESPHPLPTCLFLVTAQSNHQSAFAQNAVFDSQLSNPIIEYYQV